jgi:hypothetical protein
MSDLDKLTKAIKLRDLEQVRAYKPGSQTSQSITPIA